MGPPLAQVGAGILETAARALAVLMESASRQEDQVATPVEALALVAVAALAVAVTAVVVVSAEEAEEAVLAVVLSLAVAVAVLEAGVAEHLRIAVGKGAVGTEVLGSSAIVVHVLLQVGAKSIVMLSTSRTTGMPRAVVNRPSAVNARPVNKYRDSGLSACQILQLPVTANRVSVLSVKDVARMVRAKTTAPRARPV